MTMKLQDTFFLLPSRVFALWNSFMNARAAKKQATEICLLPTITEKGEMKKRKKEKAVLEFYQTADPVKTGENGELILLLMFGTHILCELPCSSVPHLPAREVDANTFGRGEKELLLPLQTHTGVSHLTSTQGDKARTCLLTLFRTSPGFARGNPGPKCPRMKPLSGNLWA